MAKLVYALLACVALAAPASASAQASTPSKKTTYFAGQSGRYMVDGTWYFRLDPANRQYEPQRYDPRRVQIQGRLAGLIRRY